MQPESISMQEEIKIIENLFFNKQLDQFVERVQKNILPHVGKKFNFHWHKPEQKPVIEQKTQIKDSQKKTQTDKKNKKDKKVQTSKKEQIKQNNQKQSEKNKGKTKNQILENNQQNIKQVKGDQVIKQSKNVPQKVIQKELRSKQQEVKQALKNSKIDILQKYQEMKFILFKLERQVQKLQTPMNQKTEWKINKINQTSRLGVKVKSTIIELRYEGLVQTNIQNLCIMIYLCELYKEWVPFCTSSRSVNQPSPLEKIILLDLKIPFLTERYAYFHGMAIDKITKDGKLYIYGEGITHEKQLLLKVHKASKQQYQKKVAKSVVFDAKYFICEISNQGDGKFMFKIYGILDSHMPLLPQKVVNYIVKQLGGMIFDKIVKRANNFKGTPFQKQLEENAKRPVKNKFYDWLHERISTWSNSEAKHKSKI